MVMVVVAVAVVGCRGKRGRADRQEESDRAMEDSILDGCEGRNIAVHIGVGSFSLLRLLSQAAVT